MQITVNRELYQRLKTCETIVGEWKKLQWALGFTPIQGNFISALEFFGIPKHHIFIEPIFHRLAILIESGCDSVLLDSKESDSICNYLLAIDSFNKVIQNNVAKSSKR